MTVMREVCWRPRASCGATARFALAMAFVALGALLPVVAKPAEELHTVCLPGTAYVGEKDGVPMCAKCNPGNFSVGGLVKDEPRCTSCLPGQFAPGHGNKHCWPCQEGKYMSHKGAPLCWDCPAGFFQPYKGHYSCYHCPVGTYQSLSGQTSCLRCDKCEKGRYGTTKAKKAENGTSCECRDCPKGQYTAAGHIQCYNCPGGRFQNEQGNAFCYYCPAGTYSAPGAEKCVACDYETYQDKTGQEKCSKCPVGQYQHMRGQKSCRDSPAHRAQLDLHKQIDHSELR